jgi:hypothetical protein
METENNQLIINEPIIFTCYKCNYSTYDKSNYTRHCKSNKHMGIKKDKQIRECIICDKKFKSWLGCKKHKESMEHKYKELCYINNTQ